MKRILIAVIVLVLVILAGFFGFKHFITDRTLDWGVMENPNPTAEPVMVDGDYTYVDNEALLTEIRGTWASSDGRYSLTIRDEGDIALSLDGETVLEDQLQFVYLQPGYVASTEFDLTSCALRRGDGTAVGEIRVLRHEHGDDGGSIVMEVTCSDGSSEAVTFSKTANDN